MRQFVSLLMVSFRNQLLQYRSTLKIDLEMIILIHRLKIIFAFTVGVNLELETFKSLDAFIGPQLSTIASTISEQCAMHAVQTAQTTAITDSKFVYFNRLNLAYKSSVSISKKKVLSWISSSSFTTTEISLSYVLCSRVL